MGMGMKRAASAFIMLLVLFLILVRVSEVSTVSSLNVGEIRILPDGSVEGTDKIQCNGDVYTLVSDIDGSIRMPDYFISLERDNIVFDGAGRTIQGTGVGIALKVWGRSNVTIQNLRIDDFGTGIELRFKDFETNSTASNNRVVGNTIKTTYWGMTLDTNNGVVSDNTIISTNSKYGVLFSCNNTVFSGNRFVGGGLILDEHSIQNTVVGNTVDGKPLVYLESVSNQVVDGAGEVFLVNCNNMTIRNVNPPADFRVTIELVGTSNSAITSCRGKIVLQNSHGNTISQNWLKDIGSSITFQSSAIELSVSHNNTIVSNEITGVNSYGISLVGSDYNNVYGNRISSSGSDQAGIRIESTASANSVSNWVHENTITNSGTGIYLKIARNNAVYGNSIVGCGSAIKLSSAFENLILGNNITNSSNQGIYFFCSDENSLHHNNFINNQKQATEVHEVYWWATRNDSYYSEHNAWDNGEEGNFWSDYAGKDGNGDGIGDTPYSVYEKYTDRYPLMVPFDISTINAYLPDWVPASPPTNLPPYTATEELRIAILSPQNINYNTTEVPLVFTISAFSNWMGYSLDSQENVAIAGNTTLTGLSDGPHGLTVSANDTDGFVISSEPVHFHITKDETQPQPQETTLITVAVASAASATVVGAGLLFYFKRKR